MTSLSDFEYRVWMAYELTADDYGVMRQSAVTVQAADDSLAKRPQKAVEAALKRLVEVGLVQAFEHQGRTYVYQETWQNFQRVKHPRDTMQPAPPNDQLSSCTAAMQKLFLTSHPVFLKSLENTSAELPQDIGKVSEILPQEISEIGSLACARTRETANGRRLMANGSQGVQGEADPPMDVWVREFQGLYPPHRVSRNARTEHAFVDALVGASDGAAAAWTRMKANLSANVSSYEWRVKGMIPMLEKYLVDGLWQNVLPQNPVSALVTDKTAGTLTAAAEAKRLHR